MQNLIRSLVMRIKTPGTANAERKSEAGFTLMELLVVMAILVMLAGVVAPRVLSYVGSSRVKTAKVQIEGLTTSLELFKLDTGRYPTTQEGLDALIRNPGTSTGWAGPYLNKTRLPVDPWGNAYAYAHPGRHGSFDLSSLGADKKQGGEGDKADVTNW